MNPSTIVLYMDVIMNTLTDALRLNPLQHKPESPERIIHILKGLEQKANARDIRFVVVLCRRKTDENEPGTSSQQHQMPPNDTLLDSKMNRLLKDNLFHYFDLKLSNSAMKLMTWLIKRKYCEIYRLVEIIVSSMNKIL